MSKVSQVWLPTNPAVVSTDAAGNITGQTIVMVDTPVATAIGQTNDNIALYGSFYNTSHMANICDTLVNGLCSAYSGGTDYGSGQGSWSFEIVPDPESELSPVPVMSRIGLTIMVFALLVAASRRLRAQRRY